ncbi:MAG: hypothetical protein JXB08_06260 [Bacilli bacterium]|nr:hypothetical protein [Bacilli bacterium]MBN2877279.1 hypothetical protein [Bacilli bacterium]
MIKNEKEHLLKDDLNKIILLSKNKVNRNTVHSFILQEQLSETIVNEAMDSVRKHFQSKPDYTLLLDSLFM